MQGAWASTTATNPNSGSTIVGPLWFPTYSQSIGDDRFWHGWGISFDAGSMICSWRSGPGDDAVS
jgi:hypothetical protein